ncbi:MAG: hypothetical protein ACYDHM_05975 [Acidiferrobacterales bacterium]
MNNPAIAGSSADSFVGLWRRRLFETESVHDTETEVWWLQTEKLYADLHLAPAAPNRQGARRGDAGATNVHGDLLARQGWLEDPQHAGTGTIRRMHFDGHSLVGQGVHTPLREIWERMAPPSDDRLALSLRDECAAAGEWRARRGVFVALGDYFMIALDRSLCLKRGTCPQTERKSTFALFRLEHEISFGVRHGRLPWEILRSTQPYREGQSLLSVHGLPEPVTLSEWRQRAHIPSALRRWQVVEIGRGFRGLI